MRVYVIEKIDIPAEIATWPEGWPKMMNEIIEYCGSAGFAVVPFFGKAKIRQAIFDFIRAGMMCLVITVGDDGDLDVKLMPPAKASPILAGAKDAGTFHEWSPFPLRVTEDGYFADIEGVA